MGRRDTRRADRQEGHRGGERKGEGQPESNGKRRRHRCWAAPTGLQALYLPSPETKGRAGVSNRDISALKDGGAYTSEARPCGGTRRATVCSRRRAGCGSLCYQGEREVTSYRGTDGRLAHRLPGKPAEGHAPHTTPLISYHGGAIPI